VRQGFDPANREHQSTMVRQLVHFLQALAGRSRICRGVLIQEARQIESYWRDAVEREAQSCPLADVRGGIVVRRDS
jgi:hypothetical protein